ncbi:MAG: hypothetical protein JJ863_27025 [Deltaproteobacteria bacterium]|nr:hypothetical protein [Deltaproteobacteria bacterium]
MNVLRVVALVVVGLSGVALAWAGAGAIGWLLVLVGWLAVLGWVAVLRRSQKRLANPEAWYLELDEEGLTLRLGGEPERVRWPQVAAVRADEDSLTVQVDRQDGAALKIPLLWKGVGLHDLAGAIAERLEQAPDPG